MRQKLLYLFALVEPERSPEIQPGGILLRDWNGLQLAYKEVDKREFGDNLSQHLEDLEWVKKQALAHEQGIQSLLPLGTVIPFKFGRIFESWEGLTHKLAAHQDFWIQEIDRLRGKQEWSLKVVADAKAIREHLQNNQPDLKKAREQIAKSSAGKAFFLKKKQEEHTKKRLNQHLEDEAQRLLKKLESLTKDLHLKPSPQTEGQQGQLLINGVVLLDKKLDFFAWVEHELEPLVETQAYRFLVSGPWAAYHFLRAAPQNSAS